MAVRHLKWYVSWVQTVDALIAYWRMNGLNPRTQISSIVLVNSFLQEDEQIDHITAVMESNFREPANLYR